MPCSAASSRSVFVGIDVVGCWEEMSVLVDVFWGFEVNGRSLVIGEGFVDVSSARSQRRRCRRRRSNALMVIAPFLNVCLAAYCSGAERTSSVLLL